MAGDWLAMRLDLDEDPTVIAVAEQLGTPELWVVGAFWKLWSWANSQTEDGIAPGVSPGWIDRLVQKPGFSAAAVQCGWLISEPGGVRIPEFERWNSLSAKTRIHAAARQRKHRAVTSASRDSHAGKTPIPAGMRRAVMARDGNACVYCGAKEGQQPANLPRSEGALSLDHVIPEAAGGATTLDNLATCCIRCNRRKSDRDPDEAGLPWPAFMSQVARDCGVTREEERREEEPNPPIPPPGGGRRSSPAAPRKARPRWQGPLPDALNVAPFPAAWDDHLRHREEIRKPVTPTAGKKALAELMHLGPREAARWVEHSTAKGWQGIFEPEKGAPSTAAAKSNPETLYANRNGVEDPAIAERRQRKAAERTP